jgi:hypothetical protein
MQTMVRRKEKVDWSKVPSLHLPKAVPQGPKKKHPKAGYPSSELAKLHHKHGCVYLCQKPGCGMWHYNKERLPADYESYRDHLAKYARAHDMIEPWKPHCHKCDSTLKGRMVVEDE